MKETEKDGRVGRLKREEILLAYEAGPDAVCELVLTRFAALEARLLELEKRPGKNSSNSGKPPSSDGLRRTASLRPQNTGRKPGGQPGHKGHTLVQSDQPDETVTLASGRCGACGASLEDVPATGVEKRQVFDLPPPRLVVTEFRAARKQCPCCGVSGVAAFPPGVEAPAQYGPGIKALMTHLHATHLLPVERTADLVGDLCGHRPGAAAVVKSVAEAAALMGETVDAIGEALVKEPVVHVDETGVRCERKTSWLHVCSTPLLTHYSFSTRRGTEGFAAAGILPRLRGVAVHDFWKPYQRLDCVHAYCNAHLLRELKFMGEVCGHGWAGEIAGVLMEMKSLADSARKSGRVEPEPAARRVLETRHDGLVAASLLEHPANTVRPAGKRRGRIKQSLEHLLLMRLDREREGVLRFLADTGVPFDNNQAERDLRMMKVQQKVSGCHRSRDGAERFCVVRSYLGTAWKLGLGLLDCITDAFRGSFFSVPCS